LQAYVKGEKSATVCPSSAGQQQTSLEASPPAKDQTMTAGIPLICDQAARFDDPVLAGEI